MRPFSAVHFLVVLVIFVMSMLTVRASRRGHFSPRTLRCVLGFLLAANELFRYWHDGLHFPNRLPIHLCTVASWTAVYACLTLSPLAIEFVYFVGLSGGALALINPDLPRRVQSDFFSYECLRYIAEHATLVIAASVLVFGGIASLRRGAIWRANWMLVLFAMVLLAFNLRFGTNYMFLLRKPGNPSLLDWFGPWPFYLFAAELFAILLFGLMWMPFSRYSPRRTSNGLRRNK